MSEESEKTNQIRQLVLSSEFGKLAAYSKEFNLFEAMGVNHKELVHSNVLAHLLNPEMSHGLGHAFLDQFLLFLMSLESSTTGTPLSFADIMAATSSPVKVDRELEFIDIVIDFFESKLVIAIENKIWSGEKPEQIKRYQETLCRRYPIYKKALVFLTRTGKIPETADKSITEVPVYCMSYSVIAKLCEISEINASEPVTYFLQQFKKHLEVDMGGKSEAFEICLQLFDKYEDACKLIAEHYQACIYDKIHKRFDEMKDKIELKWKGNDIEVAYNISEDNKLHDIDIRSKKWPDGIYIKLYKHGWFGVFPYIMEENVTELREYLAVKDAPVDKGTWSNYRYYPTKNENLERCINSDGNSVSKNDINKALDYVDKFIEEINDKFSEYHP